MDSIDLTGKLRIYVTETDKFTPVPDALIELANTGNPNETIYSMNTDSYGRVLDIVLEAPPLVYSQTPTDNQPYGEYNLRVSHPDYETSYITGIEIFPGITSIADVILEPSDKKEEAYGPIVIPGHTLFEYYPPKIAESAVKPISETGEIVLSRVVIPETIVVHDGAPSDSTATDYYVPYLDYIKNVVCCEIYSTWPESTIIANILAIMSLTLNRVYTEWYRNKKYNFTITSSTAYDQKWVYGQTIAKNVSELVDSLYSNYLAKPGVSQPLFTQYCDGKRVNCPNWMSQWGSKYLGDDGYSAIDIIRYYYGSDIYIGTANTVSGIPSSYPGYELSSGVTGDAVLTIQKQLNRISQNYPAIPQIAEDGIYGPLTKAAVMKFQEIFGLPESGITDFPTWYKISQIYVGVTKIGENF
jgi:peptidoglycan hydrolase-like protein with peptidoglycan-binding domain